MLPDTRDKKHDDGTRKVDRKAQRRVMAAYRAVLKGGDTGKITRIAEKWNAAGVRGLNGQPWSASTLSLFLRSPRNAGLRDHNGEIVMGGDGKPVKGTWPPLVDEDLWRLVQTVLNAPGRAPGPKTVAKHPLTGVLWCGRAGCVSYLGGRKVRSGPMNGSRDYALTYCCQKCRGVAVRATDVEPLVMGALIERLSRPDAVKLLRSKTFDPVLAAKLREEEAVLRAKLLERSDMLDKDEITREQFARSTANLRQQLDDLAQRQDDQERRRIFDGIPLGTDKVAAKVKALPPERLRAVISALMKVTIKPVGKGYRVFKPERIAVEWKDGR